MWQGEKEIMIRWKYRHAKSQQVIIRAKLFSALSSPQTLWLNVDASSRTSFYSRSWLNVPQSTSQRFWPIDIKVFNLIAEMRNAAISSLILDLLMLFGATVTATVGLVTNQVTCLMVTGVMFILTGKVMQDAIAHQLIIYRKTKANLS